MAITGSLLVDTVTMTNQAAEVRRLANAAKVDFQAMKEIMEKTRNYWIGEAGDLHRKLYDDQKDDIDVMLRRILEHPTDLEQMAGIYTQAENTNVSTAQALPSDAL